MHPVHNVKKAVTVATTKKKVASGIGEEFLENKQLLANVQNALKGYVKSVEQSNTAWDSLFKAQHDFAAAMTSAYPRSDSVRATAQQYATHLNTLRSDFSLGESPDKPFKLLHRTVEKYLQEIADVQKTYSEVEQAYSEYLRYTQKSDRLNAKKNRNATKVDRNVDKREKSRADFEAKYQAKVEVMKAIYEKHPVVFQVAMCSFWLRNDQTIRLFADHTGQMHSESDAAKPTLMEVDLTQPQTYTPLLPAPDVPLITYPPSSVPQRLQSLPTQPHAVHTPPPHASLPDLLSLDVPPAQHSSYGAYSHTASADPGFHFPPATNPEMVPLTPPTYMPPVADVSITPPPIVEDEDSPAARRRRPVAA